MGTHEVFLAHGRKFSAKCRADRNCFHTLDVEYQDLLEAVLIPNSAEVINGSACMVMSRNTTSHPVGDYVCHYADRQAVGFGGSGGRRGRLRCGLLGVAAVALAAG
jgi:hypothetical protein